MSTNAAVDKLRDIAKRKGTIYVRNKAPDGSGYKLLRATLLEVMRAAVRVHIDGRRTPEIVRFNEVEFEEPARASLPSPAPVAERKIPSPSTLSFDVGPEAAAKAISLMSDAQPEPEPVSRGGVESSIDAWLAMGMELAGEIDQELLRLDSSRDSLQAEAAAIEAELAQIAERKSALRAMRKRLSGGKE